MSVKVINRKCPQEKLKRVWDQKGEAASKIAQRELWLGPIGSSGESHVSCPNQAQAATIFMLCTHLSGIKGYPRGHSSQVLPAVWKCGFQQPKWVLTVAVGTPREGA